MNVYLYPSNTETPLKNIYIGEYGWKPGANTVAYYPLTENANDYSGNGYNATNNGGTFSEENGGYFGTVKSRITLPSMNIGQTFTISAWIKLPNGQPTGYEEFDLYYDRARGYFNLLYGASAGGIICYPGNGGSAAETKQISASFGTGWNNIVLSKSGTTFSVYHNGTLLETWTSSYNPSLPCGYNTVEIPHHSGTTSEYSAYGYLKDYIIENKVRTAQEVSEYYNQTKSNYGL